MFLDLGAHELRSEGGLPEAGRTQSVARNDHFGDIKISDLESLTEFSEQTLVHGLPSWKCFNIFHIDFDIIKIHIDNFRDGKSAHFGIFHQNPQIARKIIKNERNPRK